jgi:nitrate reductase cytochrome c-type subunit
MYQEIMYEKIFRKCQKNRVEVTAQKRVDAPPMITHPIRSGRVIVDMSSGNVMLVK